MCPKSTGQAVSVVVASRGPFCGQRHAMTLNRDRLGRAKGGKGLEKDDRGRRETKDRAH